jgi:phage tail tube protein FII
MADTRVFRLVRAIINGYPVMGELEGYSPPDIEKEMEEAKGGRFVAGEVFVGLKKGPATLKLTGVGPLVMKSMGVSRSESCEITVLASAIDEDGIELPMSWSHSGEIISIKSDEVKPGKFSHSLEFSVKSFVHIDGGVVIYDINERTQKCVVGGKDLLETSRANVVLL